MSELLKALEFRHACKIFDESKKIQKDDLLSILEAARVSPSSFGMEGWKFLVISNDVLRQKMKPLCWNQPQITTASHLVVVLCAIDALKVSSGIPQKRLTRRGLNKELLDGYVAKYDSFIKALGDDDGIFAWGSKQTYIAAANMMSQAAMLKIDSCPIEGFEKGKLESLLELDTKKYQISLIVALGYRLNKQTQQLRVTLDEIVEFIN